MPKATGTHTPYGIDACISLLHCSHRRLDAIYHLPALSIRTSLPSCTRQLLRDRTFAPAPPARTPASRLGLNVNVNVSVNVEFKVTLHEQVRYRGHLTVLKVRVCHTAGHYGEEYDGNVVY